MKYTYANWVCYFFGDILPGNKSVFSPDLPIDLKRVAFATHWLSKFVFQVPLWESMSPAILPVTTLLAEGIRLPLGPCYLGGLYGCLDQLQEQMSISYGCFSLNSYLDIAFLQLFLYERFPDHAPIHNIL